MKSDPESISKSHEQGEIDNNNHKILLNPKIVDDYKPSLLQKLLSFGEIYGHTQIGEGSFNSIFLGKTPEKEIVYRTVKDRSKKVSHIDGPESPYILNSKLKRVMSNMLALEDTGKNTKPDIIEGTTIEYQKKYDGDLSKFLRSSGNKNPISLNKASLMRVFFQTLVALNTLHNNGIIHGDIKPKNIVFRWNEKKIRIAVIDLDGLRFVDENGKLKENQKRPDFTILYASPSKNYKHQDIYALFLTCLELYGGSRQSYDPGEKGFCGGYDDDISWVTSKQGRTQWVNNQLDKIKDQDITDFFQALQENDLEKALALPMFSSLRMEEILEEKSYYFLSTYPERKINMGGIFELYTRSTQNVILGATLLLEALENKENVELNLTEYVIWEKCVKNAMNKEENGERLKDLLNQLYNDIKTKMNALVNKPTIVKDTPKDPVKQSNQVINNVIEALKEIKSTKTGGKLLQTLETINSNIKTNEGNNGPQGKLERLFKCLKTFYKTAETKRNQKVFKGEKSPIIKQVETLFKQCTGMDISTNINEERWPNIVDRILNPQEAKQEQQKNNLSPPLKIKGK